MVPAGGACHSPTKRPSLTRSLRLFVLQGVSDCIRYNPKQADTNLRIFWSIMLQMRQRQSLIEAIGSCLQIKWQQTGRSTFRISLRASWNLDPFERGQGARNLLAHSLLLKLKNEGRLMWLLTSVSDNLRDEGYCCKLHELK